MSSKRHTYIRDDIDDYGSEELSTPNGKRLGLAILIASAVVMAALFIGVAQAQTPRTATISFTKPTKYSDGTDIAASTVVTYNVYQGAKGSTTKAKVGTITGTTTTINSGLQPGETCWEVTTVANGVEGVKSNEGCKTFAFPATDAVVITVT